METYTLDAVDPVSPVAPYLGGKKLLAERIGERIAAIPHDLYAEPFIGMGGVFFRRDRRPRVEVINDISADVTTLFRLLQRHFPQLLDTLRWQLTSRADFDRLMRVDPETLTDLERAARFLYLQRAAFGGQVDGRSFGTSRTTPARFDLTKLVPMLEAVHERLCGVVIERLPYADFIRRYDRAGALFYIDPPYFGCETDYGKNVFSWLDFDRLRGLLAGLKGRFLLSINDLPQVRAIFAGFAIEEVSLHYRASGRVTPARELIISGPEGDG